MNWSPLRIGLTALPLIGVAAVFYVIFSATGTSQPGPLSSFAVGEMQDFRTVSDPPDQPRNTLTRWDGSTTSLPEKRGKLVLVNFWATWCAPCVEEMPALDALQGALGSDAFEVVAVSMDQRIDDAQIFYERQNIEHLGLYHDEALSAGLAAGARGLPLSVLYDRNGQEIGRLDGAAEWDSEDAKTLLRAAIERY